MREYQAKINVGAVPDSIVTTKYGAGEYTSLSTESENAVLHAGLTLAPSDGTGEVLTQLAQALFINGIAATTFQAGGDADAITLTPITGNTGLLLPPDYTTLDGMRINFVVSITNTSATTMSIGQTNGTQFGTKKVLTTSETELGANTLIAGTRVEVVFDASADSSAGAFILAPWSSLSGEEHGIIPLTVQSGTDIIIATATVGSLSAYEDGVVYTLVPLNTSTASVVTLNVDGLGAKQIFRDFNTGLAVGQLVDGSSVTLVFNSELDGFQWVNENLVGRNLTVSLGDATGTNTLVATTVPPQTAYIDQKLYVFEPQSANTGAVTLNVDSLGPKDIEKVDGSALITGDLAAMSSYVVAYNAGHDDFHMVSPTPVDTGGSGEFPATTRLLFNQTTPPAGWVKETDSSFNNAALRMTTNAVGVKTNGSGFNTIFNTSRSVNVVSRTAGGTNVSASPGGTIVSTTAGGNITSTSLSESQLAAHLHNAGIGLDSSAGDAAMAVFGTVSGFTSRSPDGSNDDGQVQPITETVGSGSSHSHNFNGTSHSHTFNGTSHTHTFNGTSHSHSASVNLGVNWIECVVGVKS
jgi:hypothetical protein